MLNHIKKLGKGTAIYGLGGALNQTLGLLLLPIFTSYLSPADFGTIALLTILSTFLSSIFNLGLGTSTGIIYFQEKTNNHQTKTISSSLSLLLISSLILIICFTPFKSVLSTLLFDTKKFSTFVFYYLIISAFKILHQPLVLNLQFKEKQISFVILSLINTILNIGIRLFLVVSLKQGLEGMVLGALLANSISFLIYFIHYFLNFKFRVSKKIVKELLIEGSPMIPSFFFLYILQQLPLFLLEKLHTTTEVGLFSIGLSFASAISLITTAINTAWYPFYMSFMNKQEEAKIIFGKITSYYIYGIGLIVLLIFIISEPMIIIFTNEKFHSVFQIVGLCSLAYMFLGMFSQFSPPYIFKKHQHKSMFIQGVTVFINCIVSYFLIKKYALIGAGLSFFSGYLIMIFLAFIYPRVKNGYLKIQYEYKKISFFFLVFSMFVLFNLSKFDNLWISTFIKIIIWLIIILFFLFFLFKQEKKTLLKLIKKSFQK